MAQYFALEVGGRRRAVRSRREVCDPAGRTLRDGRTVCAAREVRDAIEKGLRGVLQREDRKVLPSMKELDVEMHVGCEALRRSG